MYGLTGDHSLSYWTPPSCVSTTPEPTTTTPTTPTTPMDEGALGRAMETNEALKEKISGLKQQYGPIGKQVYESLKDNLFHSFEGYLAREKVRILINNHTHDNHPLQVLGGGDIGEIQELAANSDDPFYALKYMV